MSNKQINQLPSGVANPNALVAADNADLTVTEKIKLGDIAKLATSSDVSYDNTESGIVSTNVKAAIDELSSSKVSLVAAPASAIAPGTAGQIAYDANYIYICIADNTWKRISVNSWDSQQPTITGFVADSSFGAAEGNYCEAGTYAGSPYYAGSNSDGSSNGWLMYFDADLYGWFLSQTDTPGVGSANAYAANGDPDAPPLTGWYGETATGLTLTTGNVCFE